MQGYFLLDELLLGGYIQEPSKKIILKAIQQQEALIEEANDDNQEQK
jgi:AP-1 complex subunit sigma 1/2